MEMKCIFNIGKKHFLYWPRLLRWAMWPMGLLFLMLIDAAKMDHLNWWVTINVKSIGHINCSWFTVCISATSDAYNLLINRCSLHVLFQEFYTELLGKENIVVDIRTKGQDLLKTKQGVPGLDICQQQFTDLGVLTLKRRKGYSKRPQVLISIISNFLLDVTYKSFISDR
jgi:hypothetical protein